MKRAGGGWRGTDRIGFLCRRGVHPGAGSGASCGVAGLGGEVP
jgi:hypothetical protein